MGIMKENIELHHDSKTANKNDGVMLISQAVSLLGDMISHHLISIRPWFLFLKYNLKNVR